MSFATETLGSIVDPVSNFIGDITGVNQQTQAAQQASQAQQQAAQQAIEEYRRQFDIGQENLQPFREAEIAALPGMQEAQRNQLEAQRLRLGTLPGQLSAQEEATRNQLEAQGIRLGDLQNQIDIRGQSQQMGLETQRAGVRSLEEQQALTGLLGPQAQQEAIDRISSGPGVDFQRQRAEQALLRNASATGGLGGARVQEALQQQALGFAQQDLSDQIQRLRGIGGGSVNAATGSIGGVNAGGGPIGGVPGMGMGATSSTVNLGQNLAQGVAGQYGNIGQARAGGLMAQGAQRSRIFNTALDIGGLVAGFM